MASLEAGFSHEIFVEWANDVKNLVLFTERGQVYSLEKFLFPLSFSIHVNHYKLLHVSLRLFSLNVDFSCICILNFNMNIVLAFPEASKIK